MKHKSFFGAEESADSSAVSSPLSRLTGMAQRNPWAAWSLLHYEFQSNVGYQLNRRVYPGKSFLPSYISISPTRRNGPAPAK
jgi:hypothetical protein